VKLESRTEDEELPAATLATYKEEVDAIISLAANDEGLSLLSPLHSTRKNTTRPSPSSPTSPT
jgi:hypothetical protein